MEEEEEKKTPEWFLDVMSSAPWAFFLGKNRIMAEPPRMVECVCCKTKRQEHEMMPGKRGPRCLACRKLSQRDRYPVKK